jgi:hypothetical protein
LSKNFQILRYNMRRYVLTDNNKVNSVIKIVLYTAFFNTMIKII